MAIIKNKINFTHFDDGNGQKTDTIQIYLGNLNINEWLDDVEAEMKIVNGDIQFTILNQHYYDKDELKAIQDELKHINWDYGYEFFDLYDFRNGSIWYLIGDRNSDTFNQINSNQNQKNLNAMLNTLKNHI